MKRCNSKADDPAAFRERILLRDCVLHVSLGSCRGRSAAFSAEVSRKTHRPEFSRVILGLDVPYFFVHFGEVFTVITAFSFKMYLYGLTRQSQPFDNGESFL
jgi:hypothetical protein